MRLVALISSSVGFGDEYLIDLNATQAAIRAGYSKKTAFVIGIENFKKSTQEHRKNEWLKKKHNSLPIRMKS